MKSFAGRFGEHHPLATYFCLACCISRSVNRPIGSHATWAQPASLFLTWPYNSRSGSILIVILWHGVFNFTAASKASKAGLTANIIRTLVTVWALVVVLYFKSQNLSH